MVFSIGRLQGHRDVLAGEGEGAHDDGRRHRQGAGQRGGLAPRGYICMYVYIYIYRYHSYYYYYYY